LKLKMSRREVQPYIVSSVDALTFLYFQTDGCAATVADRGRSS
jgi:hypothetical protein